MQPSHLVGYLLRDGEAVVAVGLHRLNRPPQVLGEELVGHPPAADDGVQQVGGHVATVVFDGYVNDWLGHGFHGCFLLCFGWLPFTLAVMALSPSHHLHMDKADRHKQFFHLLQY